jgi:hypothetical protein
MEVTMKGYLIGLLTGILLSASAFMYLGAETQAIEKNNTGTYQAVSNFTGHQVLIAVIDTQTGEVYKKHRLGIAGFPSVK